LRIVDLSGGIAGPLGVLQLAEHGADVIKVEPVGGRSDRTTPASRVHNRSRRSITIDLHQPEGREALLRLLDTADVMVEAFGPGVMAGLALDYESIRDRCEQLVYCSIPAWPTGSRYEDIPGYEALVHARTGQQWENTSFRPGPVFLHNPVASMGAMFLVPIGIMSALHARRRTGRGQHVEISLLQGAMSLTTQNWNWTDRGQFGLPKSHPAGIHQLSIFECDGGEWIHASTQAGMTPTRSEASILGIEDIPFEQLVFASPAERASHDAAKRQAYRALNRDATVETFHANGLGAEAIVAPHERLAHPQLVATGSVVQVDDPDVGTTTQLGPTIFLTGTPGAVKGPQPAAGAHTDEVLGSIGYDGAAIKDLRSKGVI
jgi:crotonobetainyl-CoA:carnitine CoA-transferase CaiB-like acyl-CoA transferase